MLTSSMRVWGCFFMAISSDIIRGHLESVILKLIIEKDRYGYEIASVIQKRTHHQFAIKEATLYAMVQRFEKKGLITSYIGTKSHGRERRYYTISPLGYDYFERKLLEWKQLKEIMSLLLETTDARN